ncbi:aerobic-type carbon monoxide dehydrogenase, large subunit CoxL/CutL-like protein [Sphaerochaeta pleomorpha str. Grapes]|uniref:Aerobic-type carbon monoxide dehydrogenase, large subunit CoxL/CutL-like protein n=1 Tax=Sphaerochaeta pleomorpha (strain ATCC BAA-1885 / DSM 22778 / Grapes) TaxID=158190 RepID=G8QQU5_SPHPG|nr:xanthine dehydrogenase family protein molybdopterin-binding subunit [Sphaerochaeta pleomorpha]AEV28726.1 aerobic-type carbon monoxide dehydrogenase, large subunit CoxL/CutL-like protein [Sphaerochaeta pleomorpha str. Grapes]
MDISNSVRKKDHGPKMDGSALYVADYPTEGMVFGKLVRSSKAKAKILDIKIPPLEKGYLIVDYKDVPGVNRVHIVKDDTPVFSEGNVEYIGDPILMVVGPDEQKVAQLANEITITYQELTPIIKLEDSDTVFFDYTIEKGNVKKAFEEADKVYIETFRTGIQEQAYMEGQGMIGIAHENRITIHGSMQCPYYIHGAVAKAMGYEASQVQIKADVTGGGFGGKEDYPSILACEIAVAAYKAKKPVRVIFDRREDMEFTPKRHPSISKYKVAVKDGKVTAMDIDVKINGGAYTTLSAVVLQRAVISALGVYKVDNLHIKGWAMKTNIVPSGAFRGFGAPQTFFAVELIMDHIGRDLGMDPLAFKLANLAAQGDETSTSGKYHFPVPLKEMVEEIETYSFYSEKQALYKNQKGRYRRGMGLSLIFHGAGFTGSGERDHIKAVAKLRKYADGKVEILASNTEIGQGIKTTFSKIVANELNVPLDRIIAADPDTDRVPDSGPTVASRSLMIVGELLRRASIKLLGIWKDGEEQEVEEHFKEPDFVIPFDLETFKGDAYPTYAWAVTVLEIEVDTLTGESKIIGVYGNYDVGTPIDTNVVIGQMEGGLMQGLGYAFMEHMDTDKTGRIRNNSFTDYIIPTSVDVPLMVAKLHIEKYPLGPYGAKGAGELPLIGAAPAYVGALEQALGCSLFHIPYTTEDTMTVLAKENA